MPQQVGVIVEEDESCVDTQHASSEERVNVEDCDPTVTLTFTESAQFLEEQIFIDEDLDSVDSEQIL
ncbi:hypothetical protein KIN20_038195 [Parelaphostrongylus tenuis]|uniref:Uncharacterized protein n=1 Tax=Parelaphostrongylus tenuis TaxID=148309 RepID=A0AAD5WMS3_PARTN|nr:hypothetical protein KIN20_038195 [Parelaphostrongylus tenuis]